MTRNAVCCVRKILACSYELRDEIRQLAIRLDGGAAVGLAGLEDRRLKDELEALFINTPQLKKTSVGQFYKRKDARSSVLSFLAPMLSEGQADIEAWARERAAQVAKAEDAGETQLSAQHKETARERDGHEGPFSRTPAAPIGPSMGPSASFCVDGDEVGASVAPKEERRVLGPAMPPPEVLEAAAQMPLPAKDDPASSDGDFTDLVGPPPPEVAEMVANASASDAGSEVVRIVALLDRLESQKLASKSGAPSADPYAILGVDPTLSGREIKRQFWKLSLLVHPDKCLAPDANKAFAALSHAAEELLDATKRRRVDADREEKATRAAFEHELKAEARRSAWRAARNEPDSSGSMFDGLGSSPALPEARQEWMGGEGAGGAGQAGAFEARSRKKSLLEQHQEQADAPKKKRKAEEEDWDRSAHAWRPFDRERDLNLARPQADPKSLVAKLPSLSSRFGSGQGSSGGRSFL
ncbi:hypothetical protein H632_c1403p0 [Helicosporidium sp. ATCC 50920]|nr:hypothetical protein H632_c1403p0 [Helicosporidium sp. ATCC 50920]|eukprot:KDD74320.1 hypothetical protein H632_c1403p0 [Helicosporidium sp. ATCC 50920]